MRIPSLKSNGYMVINWLICVSFLISGVMVNVPAAKAAKNMSAAFAQDGSVLVGEVMQTGRNGDTDEVRGAMVFRVRAFVDDGSGNNRDGDGIRNVEMIILDRDGRRVQRKTENNAGYCAFGGGEPNCNVYDFAQHNNRWPNGDQIRNNEEYTLRAIVTANDGRRTVVERTVVVELANGGDGGDLRGEVMQTGRNGDTDEVRGAMVFRVRAFVDDGSGNNRDGDGIRNVDMIILDRDGREVQRRRENNAGYCAFGGGEPNCNVYDFAQHNNRWPNGDKIRNNDEYTLRAIVTANDGRQTVVERTVVVRR